MTDARDLSIPQHICIPMDGNGRWAQFRGMSRMMGHKEGAEVVRRIAEACIKQRVPYLTLWAFSTENWRRPLEEVSFLMGLLKRVLEAELATLKKNHIRLRIIGNRHRLPGDLPQIIKKAMEETKDCTGLNLTIALDYGGRDDLCQAFKALGNLIQEGALKADDITEDLISQHLLTKELPDPDLYIRPGGVLRLSNYLLWQLAYTELYFTETLWPDFTEEELLKAIHHFQKVERRFGGLSHA
jgi:undecaprenyl diphosphate synthase